MAAPEEVTGRGTMVSVIGVTPLALTGVAVSVSVPSVNDREGFADTGLPDTVLVELERAIDKGDPVLPLLIATVAVLEDAGVVVDILGAAAEEYGDGEDTGVEAGRGAPVEELEMG